MAGNKVDNVVDYYVKVSPNLRDSLKHSLDFLIGELKDNNVARTGYNLMTEDFRDTKSKVIKLEYLSQHIFKNSTKLLDMYFNLRCKYLWQVYLGMANMSAAGAMEIMKNNGVGFITSKLLNMDISGIGDEIYYAGYQSVEGYDNLKNCPGGIRINFTTNKSKAKVCTKADLYFFYDIMQYPDRIEVAVSEMASDAQTTSISAFPLWLFAHIELREITFKD